MNIPSPHRAASFRLLAAFCATTSSSLLFAANGTWDGGSLTDGNWTTLGNWTGDTAFPGALSGTTNTDIATFNTAIANTWGSSGTPILIDSASLNIRGITFDTSAANYVIGTTGGNSLFLTSGGTIQIASTTTANAIETINAPLVIVGANGTYTFANNKNNIASSLVLGGAISGGTAGNTVLTFSSVQSGAPNVASGIISDGQATTLGINHASGTWTYSGNNTYTGNTTVNAGSARFTGNNSGGGNVTINSGGAAYFTGTNAYTGTFNLAGASSTANMYLGSDTVATGSLLGVTQINVTAGRFYLNNVAGNADRLNDSVALSLSGVNSIFQLQGNATTNTSETIGALTLGPGNSNIDLTNLTSRITTLNAASLTRAAGFGTAIINTRTLGSGASNTGRIFLTTAPSGINLVGSGGSPAALNTGVKNLAIVPWLYGTDNGVGRFITYDTVTGLRYLAANETQSTIAAAVAPTLGGTGDNVLLTTNETGITTKTINSLMLTPGAVQAVTGAGTGNTLLISSGALALTNAFTSTVSGFDSVTFGNSEGVITAGHPNAVLRFDSAIGVTNNGGITKAGAGTLILNAANTYSGATTVNQGTLQIGTGGTTGDLGTSALINVRTGSTLVVNRTGDLALGSVTGGGAISLSQAAKLTLTQTGTGNVIGSLAGVSGSTVAFAGNSTATTTINGALSTAGQLVKFESGTVNLASTRPIVSNIEIDGGIVNTLDGQTSMLNTTGAQSFTFKSGEFNIGGTYGLSGFNTNTNATSAGAAYTFTGLQTGGTLSILGDGTNQSRFALGSTTAGSVSSYTLSGGTFRALGGSSFLIGANDTGSGTSTFYLSGGKLLVSGNGNQAGTFIAGAQGNGAKQAFVWTGGILATTGYDASKLTSAHGTAVSASTNTLTNAGGTLAPGDIGTTGRTTITAGNYAVTSANASLHIDIGGTSASGVFQDAANAGKHDRVIISGTASLGGKLNVALIDGFAPTNGNTFTILSTAAAGRSGTFTNTAAASDSGVRVVLANGLSSFKVNYNSADVTLGSYLATNEWDSISGANWSEGSNWTAFTPSLAGHIGRFADSPGDTGAIAINLDADQTIAGLQFDSTARHYTIGSDSAKNLTLDNNGSASTISSTGTHTITVPVALNNNLNVAVTGGTLGLSGTLSGTGRSVTKTGAGSLTLASANTYTGGTTVSAGSVFVNNLTGSGTGTGSLSVSSGALIGGSGRISGSTTLFGQLAPGAIADSVAVLAFDNAVTLKAGSSVTIDINGSSTRGTDFDGLDFNGSLTIEGGSLTFNIGAAIADDTVLAIFDGAALTANFTSVSATGTGGYNGSFTLNGGSTAYTAIFGEQLLTLDLANGTLGFSASAVPEPSAYAALFGALSLALATRRRRTRP